MYKLKGYNVSDGYMGYDPEIGKYRLFSSEQDYREVVESQLGSDEQED